MIDHIDDSLAALEGMTEAFLEDSSNELPSILQTQNKANATNCTGAASDEDIETINKFTSTMFTLRSFKGFTQYLQGKPKKREQAQEILDAVKAMQEDKEIASIASLLIKAGVLKCRLTKTKSVELTQQRQIKGILTEQISPKVVYNMLLEVFDGSTEDMLICLQNVEAIKGQYILEYIASYLSAFLELEQEVGLDAMYPSKLNNMQAELTALSLGELSADDFEW